jgi:hypothetical protein
MRGLLSDPWFWHFKTVNAGTRSASGSMAFLTACTYRIDIGGLSCTFTHDVGQSAVFTYTPAVGLVVFDSNITVTLAGTCPFRGSFPATFTAMYSLRPDTRRDTIPVVTTGS